MRPATKFALVLVTVPDMETGRKLAGAALKARLVACANLLPKVESHYWWQGKIDSGSEVLVIFKTTAARLAPLEKLVIQKHPYDTPEFLVLNVPRGNKRYLDWMKSSVR